MDYENVTLWFAKDENEEIITIDDINDSNKKDTYSCPMCGSNLIPKAIKSKQITPHFAHIDASKCNNETMIHWWFKNKFLEIGDSFIVVSDKEREFVCKDVLVEHPNSMVDGKIYKPDVTILTECDNTIYFEMDYSNKKKVKDYIDIWLELRNIVVEVDVKKLMKKDVIPTFKALFYDGKCFNIKKNDTYYNTIGKYKEATWLGKSKEELKVNAKKLDWFWDDIYKYNTYEVDIKYMIGIIDFFKGIEGQIVKVILKKSFCTKLYTEYKKIKLQDEPYKLFGVSNILSFDTKIISTLNEKYQAFDKNYKIYFDTFSQHKSESYFNGSRKYPYKYRQVFSHYTCYIFFDYNRHRINAIQITNKLMELFSDENKLIVYMTDIIDNHIVNIRCSDCKEKFSMETGEKKFFILKGFTCPRRCKSCREIRKQNKI